jgi:DNA polymerase-4
VPAAATRPFLRSLPVGALLGVGERTEEALERRGIRTVAELADTDVAQLRAFLGPHAGQHLYDLAWGRDSRVVEPGREEKSLGSETTYAEDVHDRAVLATTVLDLADRCAARLRSGQVMGRVVTLKLRTSDFRTVTRSRTLSSPTDTAAHIAQTARELLAGVDLHGLPVRLLGVRAEQLEPVGAAALQPTLEESVTGEAQATREAERALDAVRARFGVNSLRRASVVTRSTTTARAGDLS